MHLNEAGDTEAYTLALSSNLMNFADFVESGGHNPGSEPLTLGL
jgi:hypothetical protein